MRYSFYNAGGATWARGVTTPPEVGTGSLHTHVRTSPRAQRFCAWHLPTVGRRSALLTPSAGRLPGSTPGVGSALVRAATVAPKGGSGSTPNATCETEGEANAGRELCVAGRRDGHS